MREQHDSLQREHPGTLSIHRSFLVRLYADDVPADERLCGFVEHVVSGVATEFASVDELASFMRRVLSTGYPARRSPACEEK
jgi:hypothetical protein